MRLEPIRSRRRSRPSSRASRYSRRRERGAARSQGFRAEPARCLGVRRPAELRFAWSVAIVLLRGRVLCVGVCRSGLARFAYCGFALRIDQGSAGVVLRLREGGSGEELTASAAADRVFEETSGRHGFPCLLPLRFPAVHRTTGLRGKQG